MVKVLPSVSSLAVDAKLAFDGRCKEIVVTEPELFLRIQSNGEVADAFLSVTFGGPGDWLDCLLSPCERPERSFPSYNTCKEMDSVVGM